ncbi:hypothetical protein [Kribbella sp. NPDC055071]
MVRPRTFELVRYRDPSGVSGTGVVAEGCEFSDGSVALRWRGDNPATAVWPDLDSVLAVHGHQGSTEVRWIEVQPPPIDHLFDDLHQVRPPTALTEPVPPGHIGTTSATTGAKGWAGARHLR